MDLTVSVSNLQAVPHSQHLPHGYTWGYIFRLVLQHRRPLIIANLVAVLATLISVPIPLLIPLLVDEVILEQPAMLVNSMNALFPAEWTSPVFYIMVITVLTMLLRVSSLLLKVVEIRQFTIVAKRVIFRMRRHLVTRLQRVSMVEYETLGSGKVISHLVTDLDTLDDFISNGISRLIVAVLTITGTFMVLLWMHWQLALFIIFLNPLVIYLTTKLGRRVKELKKQQNRAYATFQEVLSETLEAIQQIRAYNREQHYISRVIHAAQDIRERSISFTWKTDAASRFSFNIFLLGFDSFRALGMIMVLTSDLSLGEMMAVFGYLWFMFGPIQDLLSIQYDFHGAQAALNRINILFNLRWEARYPRQHNPFSGQTSVSIQLQQVSFAYEANTPVLDQVSFDIKAGEKVALVGSSGGGKTTLISLLLGLYKAQQGEICFNQVPITQIGLDVVRDNVATVLQHPALFNDTLRTNLTLGREMSDKQLWAALRIAQLDDFVLDLEQELDTVLGRQGVRLSGGQRQRVAVARMVLTQPKVVILDEATSALDADTETRLHDALQAYLRDKTTLIIAHRLSAVLQADRVLVFDQGRIVEQGRHEELLEKNAVYAKLYGNQMF